MLTTGTANAIRLAAHLPSLNDKASPYPYFFLMIGAIGPLATGVIAFVVFRSPRSPVEKWYRLASTGIAVACLPWALFMMSGIAD